MLLETRKRVTVYDIFSHRSSMYMHMDPKTALVNEHLLESNKAGQLHNTELRAKVAADIVNEGAFLRLGSLQVSINEEDEPNG
jgi:hypothetical protein